MISLTSATSPKSSRFGWPKPSRVETFKKLAANPTGATTRVVFQGKNVDFPIIRIPIDLPKYRMANGRTASWQEEYLANNPNDRRDLFSGDAELWDAQEAQHLLLLKLADKSDLRKYFEDISKKQVDPILLDEHGFVVNGNRRLATWRELIHLDNAKYAHFSHIDVAVLSHCDEKEIDRLEATLQIEKDIKADYSWDAEAIMMKTKQKLHGYSHKDLAKLYGKKESEVKELFDMLAYAEEYLKSRNFAGLWSKVSGQTFAFKGMVSSRNKVSGSGNQEVFKQAAFTLIDNPSDSGGRLYQSIPDIVENLELIKEKLIESFPVKPTLPTVDLDDIFGGYVVSGVSSLDIPLDLEIQKPENVNKARDIIIEVIDSQKQLNKDSEAADYLLKCCAKAQSFLMAATKDGLRPESALNGVDKQLDQIDALSKKIREYIEEQC